MKTALFALSVLAIAAPALGRDRPVPVATPDGKAIDCISTNNIRETKVRSDSVIDFVTRDGKVYRNTLDGQCPQLGFEERFAYKVSTNQLCSVDLITVLTSPGLSRGASCGLGQFQPVKLDKPAR
jgi:hypothetical protein